MEGQYYVANEMRIAAKSIQWDGSNEGQIADFLRACTSYRIHHRMGAHLWVGPRYDDTNASVLEPGDWLLRIDALDLVRVLSPNQKAAL